MSWRASPAGEVMATRASPREVLAPKAQSASPRPHRLRAVDAVKLAKKELVAHTGPIVKAGRLRLAGVQPGTGPVLHEGFYKLAAAVNRPEPGLREKAAALQKHLQDELQGLRGPAEPTPTLPAVGEGGEHVDTFITQEEPSVDISKLQLAPVPEAPERSAAELSRRELELCVEVLHAYAQETSSESRERRSLLALTKDTAAKALKSMAAELSRQQAETLAAERRVDELKVQLEEQEEHMEGLRKVVQQMLKDEDRWQKERDELALQEKRREEELSKAELHAESLTGRLREANETLASLEEERLAAFEKLRDGSNSPMMHFSTFVLGPEQVPALPSSDRVEQKRTDRTDRSQGPRASVVSTSGVHPAPKMVSEPLPAPAPGESDQSSRSPTPEGLESEEEAESLPMKKSISLRRSSEESSDSEQEPPVRPSPLASSFPALVPYLDFQKDVESDKIKAQTTAQNLEHLEKHMVLLQEERRKHMEQNQLLQAAVDSTLERILVWVQAAFDSLRDFGPDSVQQDAAALAAIRDVLAWLAERTCQAWLEPSANLQQVLTSHEERLRQALELAEQQSATTSRGEVDELRKALREQKQRAEELEEQLREAQMAQESLSFGQLVSESIPVPVATPITGATEAVVPVEPVPQEVHVEREEELMDEPPPEEPCAVEEADAGKAAARETEEEAQRMRLYRCPFAEAIDLTHVKRDRQFPYEDPEEKRLGRRQLRHFITEIYRAKRLEDRRRDRAAQPRRALHLVMQEMLRRQHGVLTLVHERSWQLLDAVAEYAASDVSVGLFADFLDGTRDLDELSFYLYCSHLITKIPEEAQVMPPSRLPMGVVSEARSMHLTELLFSDLPKARTVVQEEIQQQASDISRDSFSQEQGIESDVLCHAFLEGWRLCCLLLGKSLPHFNWRDTIMSFIQADVHARGWLDPNEVQQAEVQPTLMARTRVQEMLPVTERTTLGAFVFRVVHQLGGLTEASLKEDIIAEMDWGQPWKKEQEAYVQLCVSAFSSLERSLGVYLKWLLHSEEPRDRAVYKSVKSRIFAVRQAARSGQPWPLMHNLRCLLLLLLSHQFDLQLVREEATSEHLSWELTALLQVLRESWRRGASGESEGPDFGPELEEVGQAEPAERVSVSFTVGKNIALE